MVWHIKTRGFTLIEMMVVVAIMAIVSALVLANNGRFGGTAILQNLAYEIALTIRQAQVYSIAVRHHAGAAAGEEYPAAYGMHFQNSSPTEFALFSESSDANGVYNEGELIPPVYGIRTGYEISKLCDATLCANDTGVQNLDVSFRRPYPDAWIYTNGGLQDKGCIELRSPRGDTKAILITANGQIEVRHACKPTQP